VLPRILKEIDPDLNYIEFHITKGDGFGEVVLLRRFGQK
jgi:hypothetical protein